MGLPDFFSKKVGAGPENHLQLEGVWSSRLRFRLPETNGEDIGVMTKSKWQKALDDYNKRQGELNPRYKSRLAEEKMKANKTVEKARAKHKKRKPAKRVAGKAAQKAVK